MVKVKICGITNIEDAHSAITLGADALGFIFYKPSPRYITPEKAAGIIAGLPKKIVTVGVFVNSCERFIKRAAKLCKFAMLQFHGKETPEFCARFKGYQVIKSFGVKGSIDKERLCAYRISAYHFDAYAPKRKGGTGKSFDWEVLKRAGVLKKQVFLSGGLTETNVARAVSYLNPDWVDVSSAVESIPGKKNYGKMKNFIKAAKK